MIIDPKIWERNLFAVVDSFFIDSGYPETVRYDSVIHPDDFFNIFFRQIPRIRFNGFIPEMQDIFRGITGFKTIFRRICLYHTFALCFKRTRIQFCFSICFHEDRGTGCGAFQRKNRPLSCLKRNTGLCSVPLSRFIKPVQNRCRDSLHAGNCNFKEIGLFTVRCGHSNNSGSRTDCGQFTVIINRDNRFIAALPPDSLIRRIFRRDLICQLTMHALAHA